MTAESPNTEDATSPVTETAPEPPAADAAPDPPAADAAPDPPAADAAPDSPEDSQDADARSEATLALACLSLDERLSPTLRQRCPRCGEQFPKTKKHEEVPPPTECGRCGSGYRSSKAGELLVERKGAFREFFRGMAYLPRGALRLVRTPRLWPYATVPLILNILALIVGGLLAYYVVRPWLNGIITGWEEEGGVWAVLRWGLVFLEYVGFLLVFPAIAFLIVCPPFNIAYKLVFMPVMEILTEATERVMLGLEDRSGFNMARFYANLVMAIIDAVLLTVIQVVTLILLLPLNFIPFVGSAIWAVVPPAIFASMDYTDINLVRRGYTTREKTRLWGHFQWRFFGYGLAFCFFITVPLLNVAVIPAAAVGGAMLYLELDRK